MQYLKRIRSYELVAFATGFALMAYELAGSRILSPVVGSSTYVWTSIIGVIVAALSLGYAAGGIVADRRVRQLDVVALLLASGLTVIMTVALAQPVLDWVVSEFGDARVQGLVASLLLFMPTSFLLGMISPYLARLRTESVATTGTSIAGLSALNAIGGILGTFCTGFIFFGFMSSDQSLWLVGTVLVLASWLLVPRLRFVQRIVATLTILLLGAVLVPFQSQRVIASIDTPSSHYTVRDIILAQDGGQRRVRVLQSGAESTQSGVYLDGSSDLVFGYTRKMAQLVAAAPEKRTILILGGGAYTMPQHLAEKYPDAQIDVVEIDPKLVAIAREYFHYKDPRNVTNIAQDARTFLNGNTKQYDIVLVDVYSELAIPFSVSTQQFGAALKRAVAPSGFAAINIIGSDSPACRDLLRGIHGSYKKYFDVHMAYPVRTGNLQESQNIISVYAHKQQPWLPAGQQLTVGTYQFTDDYAPVERLLQQCVSSR